MKKTKVFSLFFMLVAVYALGLYTPAKAATATVNLGTATPFAILAGSAITNVPTSNITGDVGLSPAAGTFYSGLTQAEVTGTIYSVNASGPAGYINNPSLMTTAKNDLTTAFTDAANRTPVTSANTELGGTTKTAGVYASESTTFQITAGAGPLVIDAQGDSSAVFIFQMGFDGTGLTVGPGSTVSLLNGATACNIFWVVNTAAINTTAVFKGNILALNSITVANGANIEGRLLARNANVTLIGDTITTGTCATAYNEAQAEAARVAAPSSTTITAAATATTTATAVAAKLPNTGVDPSRSNILWNVVVFSGLALIVTTSLIVALRKRKITL